MFWHFFKSFSKKNRIFFIKEQLFLENLPLEVLYYKEYDNVDNFTFFEEQTDVQYQK